MGCSLLSITEIVIFLTTSLNKYVYKKTRKVNMFKKSNSEKGRVFTASNTFPLMRKLGDLEYQLKVNIHGVEKCIQAMSKRLRSLETSISRNENEIAELKIDLEKIVSKAVKKEVDQLKCRKVNFEL